MSTAILKKSLAVFTIAFFTGLLSVRASGTNSGSISGTFSDPVLTGYVIDLQGNHVPLDNTTSAFYFGVGTNTITWGQPIPGFTPPSSSITFTGKSFSGVAPGQEFDLGTISFTNATNFNDTFIFGATLTLTVDSTVGGSVDPGIAHLGFIATQNGTGSARADADFVTFDVFPVTFNVLEGQTATAELFGTIVGDPFLSVTGIQLNPGQENNGFIGHGQPSAPDSGGTVGLMGIALAVLVTFGVTRKNTSTVD
jgi:hypothetical protein